MPGSLRDVVFVDGVRTPFGKAGPTGMYAGTRADDLVVKCIRELLRRNPGLPPDRVDEVAVPVLRPERLHPAADEVADLLLDRLARHGAPIVRDGVHRDRDGALQGQPPAAAEDDADQPDGGAAEAAE